MKFFFLIFFQPFKNVKTKIIKKKKSKNHFWLHVVVVQSLRYVRLFVTPWAVALQTLPLSSTISQSLLKLISIELVMLSNHLILCCPHLLWRSILPSIRAFPTKHRLYKNRWLVRFGHCAIVYLD